MDQASLQADKAPYKLPEISEADHGDDGDGRSLTDLKETHGALCRINPESHAGRLPFSNGHRQKGLDLACVKLVVPL